MSATTTTDFSQLPDVFFTEQNTGNVEKTIILIYEKLSGKSLSQADPVRLFLSTLAAVITQRNIILDQTGKMNMLRYAKGDYLDHIGAMLDCYRLKESAAETAMRYSIAKAVDFPVLVPAGNRITADANLFFDVTESAIIRTGDTYVDVPAKCLTAGSIGNGLVAGQINMLVDPLAVVVTVSNLTTTTGGADIEEDEPYRERIHMAPEKFTCAGSEMSYVYFARSAHPGIADVAVDSPTPGRVHVYVLLENGVIPNPDGPEIAAVVDALSAKKVRPLTDDVHVLPCTKVDHDYVFTYYLSTTQAGFVEVLDEGIKAANRKYESWQRNKNGRDINPDELVRLTRAAGAKRIVAEKVTRNATGEIITREPLQFKVLAKGQVAYIPDVASRVFFGGLEDE